MGMIEAVAHMHSKAIVHRDIKPDNFLVAADNKLKLADLGMTVDLPMQGLLTDKCGTPAFMAPEIHKLPRGGYGLPVDMWASGICMYMVMSGGKHPFISGDALNKKNMLTGYLD